MAGGNSLRYTGVNFSHIALRYNFMLNALHPRTNFLLRIALAFGTGLLIAGLL